MDPISSRPAHRALIVCALLAGCTGPGTSVSPSADLDRTKLPIEAPTHAAITTLDARDATPPPAFSVDAPAGAPNVVIVLIDDIGFGTANCFGGGIETPTLDRLAAGGLRFNQFHTTALCSPTRMALLTGRNHHSANTGSVMEVATAFPGNQGVRPRSVEPVAEMLRLNGFSTAAFGKYHETAPWEVSVSGPFDRWPTRSGFDKFYGFIGGETNQWAPFLHDGTTPIEPPHDPDYHVTTDLASEAIEWMRFQKALTPEKPFFVYFATGATHAPHQVPQQWIDMYKGKFDMGWDEYRKQTLARQIERGVVPAGTQLAKKPDDIKDWESLSADEKRLYAKQMEVFAAFATHTDHNVGRMVDALDAMGELDNTLFLYIWGDNGCSAEGGLAGTFNEMIVLNGLADKVEDQLPLMDKMGGKDAYGHFHAGWAHAGQHALPVDQAGRFPLRRYAQPARRALAEGLQGQGRSALAMASRHGRRPHDHGGGEAALPDARERRQAEALRGREHALLRRRRGGRRPAQDAVLRDVRQPRHLPRRLVRDRQAPHALEPGRPTASSPTTSGSSTTSPRTSARRRTSRPSTRTSSPR